MQEFETLLGDLQRWHVMVLITARKAVGATLRMVKPLCVGALPEDTSVQLLTDLAGGSSALCKNEATELVATCGYNALAITLLAGLIKNQYCSPKVRACFITQDLVLSCSGKCGR